MSQQADDPLPSDPLDAALERMDQILRDLGLGDSGDVDTIKRRYAIDRLLEQARLSVAIEAQREVRESRTRLDAAADRRRQDTHVIRALVYALNYYADARNWQGGCPVHVNAFDLRDVRLDWGECAQDALDFVSRVQSNSSYRVTRR